MKCNGDADNATVTVGYEPIAHNRPTQLNFKLRVHLDRLTLTPIDTNLDYDGISNIRLTLIFRHVLSTFSYKTAIYTKLSAKKRVAKFKTLIKTVQKSHGFENEITEAGLRQSLA